MGRKRDPYKLNDREKDILKFIEKELNKNGYPPSVREIGQAVGLKSTATVHAYLNRLEKIGKISRKKQKNYRKKVTNCTVWHQSHCCCIFCVRKKQFLLRKVCYLADTIRYGERYQFMSERTVKQTQIHKQMPRQRLMRKWQPVQRPQLRQVL